MSDEIKQTTRLDTGVKWYWQGFGAICARCGFGYSAQEFVTVGGRVLCKDCRAELGMEES